MIRARQHWRMYLFVLPGLVSVGADAAEVLDTFVYFRGVVGADWGFSTAVGLVKGAVGTALVLGANWLSKRFDHEGLF